MFVVLLSFRAMSNRATESDVFLTVTLTIASCTGSQIAEEQSVVRFIGPPTTHCYSTTRESMHKHLMGVYGCMYECEDEV